MPAVTERNESRGNFYEEFDAHLIVAVLRMRVAEIHPFNDDFSDLRSEKIESTCKYRIPVHFVCERCWTNFFRRGMWIAVLQPSRRHTHSG